MFKLTDGDRSIRPTAGRIATTDPRFHVYGAGFTIERPHDVRGDSVNQLCVGGRLDLLTEALDAHRAKSDRAAVAERSGDVAIAQAVNDQPVTGFQPESVAV